MGLVLAIFLLLSTGSILFAARSHLESKPTSDDNQTSLRNLTSVENLTSVANKASPESVCGFYFGTFIVIFMNIVASVYDIVTDILYLFTSDFFNQSLFIAQVIVMCLPVLLKLKRLYEYGAVPCVFYLPRRFIFLTLKRCPDFSPYYYEGAFNNRINNGYRDLFIGPPKQGKKLFPLASESHSGLDECIFNIVIWIIAISCQAAYIPIVVFIIGFQLFVFLPIWFVLGVLLMWTKADALKNVWDVWYFVWTRSREFKSDEDVVLDTHILNGSLFIHFVFEAIPSMLIQIFNNILLNAPWTPIAYVSIVFSLYNVLSGLYRYVYHRHMKCFGVEPVELQDVPINKNISILLMDCRKCVCKVEKMELFAILPKKRSKPQPKRKLKDYFCQNRKEPRSGVSPDLHQYSMSPSAPQDAPGLAEMYVHK
jgi:hypothetical protein